MVITEVRQNSLFLDESQVSLPCQVVLKQETTSAKPEKMRWNVCTVALNVYSSFIQCCVDDPELLQVSKVQFAVLMICLFVFDEGLAHVAVVTTIWTCRAVVLQVAQQRRIFHPLHFCCHVELLVKTHNFWLRHLNDWPGYFFVLLRCVFIKAALGIDFNLFNIDRRHLYSIYPLSLWSDLRWLCLHLHQLLCLIWLLYFDNLINNALWALDLDFIIHLSKISWQIDELRIRNTAFIALIKLHQILLDAAQTKNTFPAVLTNLGD